MIELSDTTQMVGYLIGSFALGYAGGYMWYLFRRVTWSVT